MNRIVNDFILELPEIIVDIGSISDDWINAHKSDKRYSVLDEIPSDPVLNKFILYGRSQKMPPEIVAAWSKYDWYKQWYSGRAVGRLESSDFLKWNLTAPYSSKVVMTADLQDPPGTEI